MEYIDFPIIPVARMCGIEFRNPQTVQENHAEVQARCPFCNDRHWHLYLNRHKNQFNCQRCKASGNSVSLYARRMNISNFAAFEALRDGGIPRISEQDKMVAPEREPAPIAMRDMVYRDYLYRLTLSRTHWDSFINERRLSPGAINSLLYRSCPGSREVDDIAFELSKKHNLEGVSGFYMENDVWKAVKHRGFYIPLINASGLIQGLQIRLDGKTGDKFRLFSSRYMENGTRCYPYIHVCGNTGSKSARLGESAMKADIANYYTGGRYLFVSMAGTRSLHDLITVLLSLKVTEVIEVFDMDTATRIAA